MEKVKRIFIGSLQDLMGKPKVEEKWKNLYLLQVEAGLLPSQYGKGLSLYWFSYFP